MAQTTRKANGRKQTKALQDVWDGLLSRQPERVKAAFGSLEASERQAVLDHLKRMANESGWQPEQRASAQAALTALHRETK